MTADGDRAVAALRGPFAGAEHHLDAPYWQTPPLVVEAMLDLAGPGPGDFLIDLGCGDGRIALAAARRGAGALGIDISAERIVEARAAASTAGLSNLARFRREDLFETRLDAATIVTLYLVPLVNVMLGPRLLTELRPGSRIVSHAFDMGDWRPEAQDMLDRRRIFLWIVPAIAGGSWALTDPGGAQYALEIEQRFQEVTGTLTGGGRVLELEQAALRGTAISFTAGGRAFAGIVGDAEIVGEAGWRARRIA